MGVSLLIQWKLVDSCSHVALMHEKTLLIQLNFSPKKWPREWQRVEKTHLIRFQIIRKNAFDPPIAIMFSYWLKNGWVINIFSWGGSNVFFRRVVIHVVNFSERNLAGSKVFSHAPASRDYIGLLDQKWYPRVVDPSFWLLNTYWIKLKSMPNHLKSALTQFLPFFFGHCSISGHWLDPISWNMNMSVFEFVISVFVRVVR